MADALVGVLPRLAEGDGPKSLDERIGDVVAPVSDKISGFVFHSVKVFGADLTLIVVWLIAAALFFTCYLGFLNVRGVKHAVELVSGKFSDPHDTGEVSHFQALATAVSGTVGLGNIAGVAIAISLGGPGATFWIIVAGFFGMSAKLAECTLGVKYRNEHADGTVSGGPMYYLERGVAQVTGMRPLGKVLGKVLAVMFSIFAIGGAIGGGNMFQANQATAQIVAVTGGENSPVNGLNWVVGLVFAIAVGLVIIGGIKSIARVTGKLVPVMAIIYVTSCLFVIAFNTELVLPAFGKIFTEAFNPASVAGGFVGVLIVGFQRAAFSNEAGIGSASIAHSAVRTKHPSTEGHVALLEPFIDTIVICTMTSLVIVITGAYTDKDTAELGGVALTSKAFESVIPWFPNVLALAVVLFAFSTMLSWSYYGMKATGYLFNDSAKAELGFKVVFVVFTVIGAAMSLEPVIAFSDSMIFLMSVPNVIGLYILARVLKRELTGYRNRVDEGEISKV